MKRFYELNPGELFKVIDESLDFLERPLYYKTHMFYESDEVDGYHNLVNCLKIIYQEKIEFNWINANTLVDVIDLRHQ